MTAAPADPPPGRPTPDPAWAAAAPALTVRLRLFAGLREAAGWGERPVQVPAGATPLSLWRQLERSGSWPQAGEALPGGVRVAINQQFAGSDTPLADGDELAFLPPISGG